MANLIDERSKKELEAALNEPVADNGRLIKIINQLRQRMADASVLEAADQLVSGPRQEAYGHPADNYAALAKAWSLVLPFEVTPEQVVLCNIMTKVVRETHRHKRDNLVDIAGYARVLEIVINGKQETVPDLSATEGEGQVPGSKGSSPEKV